MSHVFISYSHKDKAYVHRLHRALIEKGFDAWIDDRIDYGARWPREIEKRLQECSAFILVMSPDANESDWVQNELHTARDLKKPILPLLLEGKVWWHLQTTQFVDVKDGKLPPANFFVNLAGAVARHQSSMEHAREAAEKPKNEGVNIHVLGNVGGNIIVGDQNVAKSADVGHGSGDPRPTSDLRPTTTDPRSLPTSPPRPWNPIIIVALISAAATICAALLVTPSLINWLNNQPAIVRPSPTTAVSLAVTMTDTPPVVALPTVTESPSLPSPTPYPPEITQKGAKLALIPAGTFTMGSDKGETDEKPPHAVSLDAFYMDKYEVTNALYKACVDAGGCSAPHISQSSTRTSYYGNAQFDDYPVIYVDWNQSKTYCEWRDARLPTEAEWEYAARGTDQRTYPWGEGVDATRANAYPEGKDTSAVGSYESGKSPFGVYDMAGNVWEWVNDWYDEAYYANSPSFNPAGPASGQYRVLRGDSWYYIVSSLRSASRNRDSPDDWGSLVGIGFRCARSP